LLERGDFGMRIHGYTGDTVVVDKHARQHIYEPRIMVRFRRYASGFVWLQRLGYLLSVEGEFTNEIKQERDHMSAITQTIRQLQVRRNQTQRELEKLSLAIKALEHLEGTAPAIGTVKPKRKMSLAARRKIAAFQKARWAKLKAAKRK
jgi:uncharacterized protein YjcR